ncbi:MAG: A24 family peptidase, partial [Eubacterium sp.]
GKCRKCGAKIAPRYFFTEFSGGLLAILMAMHYDFGFGAIVGFAVGILLMGIALIDFDTMEIPNALIVVLMVPAILSYFVFLSPLFISRVIGIFCISLPMLIASLFIPNAFGGGDIKLMAVAGFLLGWPCTLMAAFIGIVGAGSVGIVKMIKKDPNREMAFGPYLCFGILVSLLWGLPLIDWYLGIYGL